MDRLIRTIAYRYRQVSLLRTWRTRDVLHITATELNPIRRHCPTLYIISTTAIRKLDPSCLGYFLAIVRKCAVMTAVFLLHHPSASELGNWAGTVHEYLMVNCPCVEFDSLNMCELVNLLSKSMDERRTNDPRCAVIEARLLPLVDAQAINRAEVYNWGIVSSFFRAWMAALRPVFREHLTFWQFVNVSRGFRRGELVRAEAPDMELVEMELWIDEEDYRPVGDLIPLESFCTPVEEMSEESTCSICVNEVTVQTEDAGQDDKPVMTSCSHYFHETCLNVWVNESGMSTANTCPSCRKEMCVGRARVPESLSAV